MSSLHRIKVLGRELQVRSSALPEKVQDIEMFVNGKLAEVAVSIKGRDPQLVAILTLMNIAEEYLSLVRSQEVAQQHETEKVKVLLQKFDDNL